MTRGKWLRCAADQLFPPRFARVHVISFRLADPGDPGVLDRTVFFPQSRRRPAALSASCHRRHTRPEVGDSFLPDSSSDPSDCRESAHRVSKTPREVEIPPCLCLRNLPASVSAPAPRSPCSPSPPPAPQPTPPPVPRPRA